MPQQEEHRWKLIQLKMSHRRVSSKSAARTYEHVVDGHKRKLFLLQERKMWSR